MCPRRRLLRADPDAETNPDTESNADDEGNADACAHADTGEITLGAKNRKQENLYRKKQALSNR